MTKEGKFRPAVSMQWHTHEEYFEWLRRMVGMFAPAPANMVAIGDRYAPAGLETSVDPATGKVEWVEQSEPEDDLPDPGGGGSVGGGMAGPHVDTDPVNRDRMRASAAEARLKIAEQQAQEKAQEKAQEPPQAAAETTGTETPRRGRGRPRKAQAAPQAEVEAASDALPVTTEDQSGDTESGDAITGQAAENEPTDYAAFDPPMRVAGAVAGASNGAAPTHTPAQVKEELISLLRQVHDINRGDVEQFCSTLGVKKLPHLSPDVPENITKLWQGTEHLCAKYNIPFPPAGMSAP